MAELTSQEKERVRALFDKYDRNGNGTIDWDEFCLLVDNLVGDMELDEKSLAFHIVDSDHSGIISFDEFIAWWDSRS